MALRGTLTHWKTRLLAKELGIDPPFALGILESLWHATSELAPAGNVGRLPNQAIAMEMFYTGDPDALIAALVKSGHLDEHPEHRLVVHEWATYADDATDNKLSRSGQRYADGTQPRMKRLSKGERDKLCAQFGYVCESVRTESHKEPPPVPEPVPVPVPVPVPESSEDPSVAARVLSGRLGVFDLRFEEEQFRSLKALPPGKSLADEVDFRVGQWEKYRTASDCLNYPVQSPEKFFRSGKWQDEKLWPWKEGKQPKPRRIYANEVPA